MRKFILINPYHDIQNNPESIQIKRLIEEFERQKIDITLISHKSIKEFRKYSIIFRIKIIIYVLLKSFSKINLPIIKEFFFIFDPYIVFNGDYLRFIKGKLKKIPNVILLTNSTPFSIHILGKNLKRKYQFDWYLRMSDPYTNNLYNDSNLKFVKNIKDRIEKNVFEIVDGVVVTSSNYCDFLRDKYTNLSSKFTTVYHMLPTINNYDQPRELNIIKGLYLGNVYGARKIDSFLNAIKLNQLYLEDRNVIINFYGKLPSSYSLMIKNLGIDHIVNYNGVVAHQNSQKLISEHDFCINIEAPVNVNYFFPSKMVDYMSISKPILNLSPANSESRKFYDYHSYCAEPNDIDAISESLRGILEGLSVNPNYNLNKFSGTFIYEQYKSLMELE